MSMVMNFELGVEIVLLRRTLVKMMSAEGVAMSPW